MAVVDPFVSLRDWRSSLYRGERKAGERKAGQVRYWQCGQAGKSPDLAISDLSRFLRTCPASSGPR